MPRRITATEKWDDPWFRRLKPAQKCLWLWMLDHCDLAGVVDIDMDAATFQVGAKVNLSDFEGRVVPLPNGKRFVVGFIRYQQNKNFGELDPKNNAHLSIIKSVEKNGVSADLLSVSVLALRDVTRNVEVEVEVDVKVDTVATAFVPPTLDEIEVYMEGQMGAISRRCPGVTKLVFPKQEAPLFVGYYAQRDWKIKSKAMKSWQQASYNWLIKAYQFKTKEHS